MLGFALSLAEAPAQIQALVSQITSGAWVRNGYGLLQAAAIYLTQANNSLSPWYAMIQIITTLPRHSQVEAEGMFDADLAVLQLSATLTANANSESRADYLLSLLLHRFTLTHTFDWAVQVRSFSLPFSFPPWDP